MRANEYYQMVHNREWKSLVEIIKRIKDGMWVTSVRCDKESVGNGYRLIVYFRDRK